MFLPVLFLVAPAPAIEPAPTLPPMCAPAFQAQVLAVEQCLEKGDFVTAGKLAEALPKASFTIAWDDRKVPPAMRKEIAAARDQAIRAWREQIPGATKLVAAGAAAPADLKISFEPVLAVDPEMGAPAGVVTFANRAAPRLEAVLGLKRGKPLVTTQTMDVTNDMLFAIGSYFGLARNVSHGSAMTPSPPGLWARGGIGFPEKIGARENLEISDFLRRAARQKIRVKAQQADAFIDPGEFRGEAVQGDEVDLSVQLTNRGDGPLSYRVEGDCGCMVSNPPGKVPPKSSAVVRVVLDTKEFTAVANRTVRVYTNDPREPVRLIPVTLNVVPRFRFLIPGGPARNVAENREFDVYLALAEGTEIGIRNVQLSGVDGEAKFEKWEGDLPDPDRAEPARPRKGYKFHVKVAENLPPGRAMLGLNIATDSLEFPVLSLPMTVQRGVVATPDDLYLGELAAVPKRTSVIVSRPGTVLKVLSATIDAKSITVKVVPGRDASEQRIEVVYDGTAPSGDLSATITVKLDDPKQPQLLIPVSGVVR